MLNLGTVPAGSTIYIPFSTYGGTNGESITITGLAVTDIEVYRNGSATQRASDAGFTLLDTDGIDFDGITGIHGFSIDLSDNTDAGFYSVGGFYWVVVSAVTVDSQTVNFVAAVFRIGPAETQTGYPKVDAQYAAGAAVPSNFASLSIDASGRIDLGKWLGTAPLALSSQRVQSLVGAMGSGVLTAAAIASNAITAAKIAADAIGASQLAADAAQEIRDAILNRVLAGNHDTAGTLGKLIQSITEARLAELDAANLPSDVDTLIARITAARAGYLDNLSAGAVALEASLTAIKGAGWTTETLKGIYDAIAALNNLSSAGAQAACAAALSAFGVALETTSQAIKTKTDNLPASPAAVGSAMTLTSGERDAVAAALLDLADAIETGYTLRAAVRIIAAACAGKLSGAATATNTIRAIDDSKARITATVDADGNRSAVTLDGA